MQYIFFIEFFYYTSSKIVSSSVIGEKNVFLFTGGEKSDGLYGGGVEIIFEFLKARTDWIKLYRNAVREGVPGFSFRV